MITSIVLILNLNEDHWSPFSCRAAAEGVLLQSHLENSSLRLTQSKYLTVGFSVSKFYCSCRR